MLRRFGVTSLYHIIIGDISIIIYDKEWNLLPITHIYSISGNVEEEILSSKSYISFPYLQINGIKFEIVNQSDVKMAAKIRITKLAGVKCILM